MDKKDSKQKEINQPQYIPPVEPCYEDDEIDLYELWLTIKKRKKVIIGLFLSMVSITVVISLIMTPIYRSTTTVLPISSSSNPLGSLAGLAAMAGVSVGGGESSQKVMAVLNSRTIKENVIKDLNLLPLLLEDKDVEDRNPMNVALEEFEDMVSISDDKKTGVISVSVDYKDPKMAQKIADQYIKELEVLLNEKALTVAKMNRIFIEKQLKEEEKKLKEYQKKLAEFQKKTKMIEPTEQVKRSMSLYASLVSQKISLEVQIRKLESTLSPNNPKIRILKEQLIAIDKQLKDLEKKSDSAFPSLEKAPEKIAQYTDLLRKLKTSEAIYETLTKMYEQAKLEEAKDNLYVQVIDPPNLPDKKVKPKRALMVAVSGVSSIFLGIFLAFFLEWLENIKKRRQEVKA